MLYRDCFRHLYDIERKRIPPTPADDLRLHRLERPVEWPQELVDAIWAAQHPVNHYPDYAAFYESLSAFTNIPQDRLVVGAGIEDFIRTLMLLCCNPGDRVAFTWPTCAMFEIYARVFRAKPTKIVTNPDDPPKADRICDMLDRGVKLLILPNPGQPVETCFDLHDLRKIAIRCKTVGAVFAIDEAYYGFGAPSSIPLTHEFEHVLVLRTFSKAFGAAGIRVGYATGSVAAVKPLHAVRPSGEIAGPSLAAATVLMQHWETYVVPGVRDIIEGRNWLKRGLREHGFKASGKNANHVLIDLPDSCEVADKLTANGVRVKAGFPTPLDRHLLVTAGPLSLMRSFLKVFLDVVHE